MNMECLLVIIITILCCIILILMGMLLGMVIYKVCVLGKKAMDFASVRGPSSHVISEHDYETIEPLSPHMMSHSEEETGFIEPLYSNLGLEKNI